MLERSPDYISLAARYDERYRYQTLAGVGATLAAFIRQRKFQRLLEVGCGTGHWLMQLSDVPLRVGLDRSRAMLAQAHRKEAALPLVHAGAEALPFETDTFDCVLCVNALHHFNAPQQFFAEAYRVLCPGGVVAIIGKDPRASDDRIWYYPYFPETYEIDLCRYPSYESMQEWMTAAGFRQLAWQVAQHLSDPQHGRQILSNPFLQKHHSSQLALLSEEAYQAGIRRIMAVIEEAESRGEMAVF